tara:strand:- start:270 stop:1121 length:852 start_codon:yes stop_codon:yes gene_type:complete
MADVKISALPAATTPLAGTELVPIVQSGVTEQVTVANLTAGRTVGAATVNVDANSATTAVRITQTGAGNALVVEDSANPDATPFVIDASGIMIRGNSTPVSMVYYATGSNTFVPQVQNLSSAATFGAASYSSSAAFASSIALARSASNTVGAHTTVSDNFDLGAVSFQGSDGTNFVEAARVWAEVDGTPGTNDMPGRLVFSTTADGASSPTERMRITSAGNVVAGGSVALATTATDGFLYVPTCAGTPTGTPTSITGMAPIVVNTTNNKLYFYSGGAWRDAGP